MLFIGGYGRMGSTLLDRMLGEIPGFFSAGELRYVWNVGFAQNMLCGCGRPFRECPFWREVVDAAWGRFDEGRLERVRRIQLALDHLWHVPQIVTPLRMPRYAAGLREYRGALAELYRATGEVSGAEVVVDSSKAASHALLLSGVPGLDLRAVHLVRDSRASAFSYARHKVRPEVHWERAYMPRHSALRSAVEWNVNNLAVAGTKLLGLPYVRIRYEDLVTHPRRALRRILDLAGRREEPDLSFLGNGTVRLGENHTACGNPSRYERGELPLRLDDEWEAAMPLMDRSVVTALTWPLLVAYGYAGPRGRDRARHAVSA